MVPGSGEDGILNINTNAHPLLEFDQGSSNGRGEHSLELFHHLIHSLPDVHSLAAVVLSDGVPYIVHTFSVVFLPFDSVYEDNFLPVLSFGCEAGVSSPADWQLAIPAG